MSSQKFERMLSLTGGRLAITDKKVHYALFLTLEGDCRRYMRAADTGIEIALTENFGGTAITLKRLEADKAHKLLGVHTDPAGVGEAQIKYMCKHMAEWHLRMMYSTLSPALKRLSY